MKTFLFLLAFYLMYMGEALICKIELWEKVPEHKKTCRIPWER